MTDDQQALLDHLAAALAADPRIRSAWLSGSFGKGAGDAWSDVDLTIVVDDPDLAACLRDCADGVIAVPATVFSHIVHGRIFSGITPGWSRFDLAFLTAAEFARQDGAGLAPLLGDAAARPPPRPPGADADLPARIERLVCEFLRVLGLSPVCIGRGEWLVGQQGVELLRGMLVELMLEENGVPRSARGAKRLNGFLSEGQRSTLEALPAPAAERQSLIDAQSRIARRFLAHARPLAERLGAPWPAAFEAATRDHLRRELGVEI
ncbi:nucleotidyltransferase domain-containing protein [Phenylobacterium sp.]|uniref:nucleotidyltransferase domain-containing protein n=1 Tax=Phenylobacterium sp. TaxID=1871053 RepID=UPI00289A0981|nr:nucleotidyltransferase domain-containing protein [Phenylobacterium sp.]